MKKFLKGLLAAAIGGATAVITDPHEVVKNPVATGKVAAAGATMAVLFWLVKSPLHDDAAEPKTK